MIAPPTSAAPALQMAFSRFCNDSSSPTALVLTPPSAHSSLGSSFASPLTPFGDLDALLYSADSAFRYPDQVSTFALETLTVAPSQLIQPALPAGTPRSPSPPFAVPAALPLVPPTLEVPVLQGRRKRTPTQVEIEEADEVEAVAPKPKRGKKAPAKSKKAVKSDNTAQEINNDGAAACVSSFFASCTH